VAELDEAHKCIISDRTVEDDYELIEEIGQGQYATVHKAEKNGEPDKVRHPPPGAAFLSLVQLEIH